jgi:tRNA nucleotidyltransferase (CCA-adding enzyme)
MNLFKEILMDIKPSEKELNELDFVAEHLMRGLIKKLPKDFKFEFEGSFAKQTFLSGNSDIDIFVKVPLSYDKDSFKEHITPMIEQALNELGVRTAINYASHPYVHGEVMNVDVDVCPCYQLETAETIFCAVDRTPFHTRYVIENLEEKQQDQVRILKQFLKAHGLYGANEKVKGFSGYLCELLIMKYGSFLHVLESELEDEFSAGLPKGITDIYVEDPVDSTQNVAAALSVEKYIAFVLASGQFLSEIGHDVYAQEWGSFVKDIKEKHFTIPVERKFSQETFNVSCIERDTYGNIIKLENVSDNEEVLYSKARKLLKKAVNLLERHEFKVFSSQYHVEGKDILLVLETEDRFLPKERAIEGPSIYIIHGQYIVQEFAKAHENDKLYIEADRIKCIVKRKYWDLSELLTDNYQNVTLL